MRFDVNLSILLPDLPLLERPAAAAALGFDAVELWWPFSRDAPAEAEVDHLVDAIGGANLTLVSLNLTHGDRSAGEHGLAAILGQQSRFRDSLEVAIAIARRLGCVAFNALYGNRTGEFPDGLLDATAVENVAYAARRAATVGVAIVLEALNPIDFPATGSTVTAMHSPSLIASERGRDGSEAAVRRLPRPAIGGRSHRADRGSQSAVGHVQIADRPTGSGRAPARSPLSGSSPLSKCRLRWGMSGLEVPTLAGSRGHLRRVPAERRRSARQTGEASLSTQPSQSGLELGPVANSCRGDGRSGGARQVGIVVTVHGDGGRRRSVRRSGAIDAARAAPMARGERVGRSGRRALGG